MGDSHFINTDPLGKAGEFSELTVWEKVKEAFAKRKCLGYLKYPIFSKLGQHRKEPDIMMADKEFGIIVIEVKALTIEQISAIHGHRWEYSDFYEPYGNPYEQAEGHLYTILRLCDSEFSLARKVNGRALVALPEISIKDWSDKGFNKLPCSPPILFKEDLTKMRLLEKIERTHLVQSGIEINEERWSLLLNILGGSQIHLKPPRNKSKIKQNRSSIISSLTERLFELDLQQEQIGKVIPPGPQRIRGIAGSGKTVILCQKAAHMHLKHPEKNIALIFFTRSLYDQIISHIDQWLKHFSNGQEGYDPKTNHKLKILHAWGSREREGFYGKMCELHHTRRLTVNDTDYRKPIEGLADLCKRLLEETTIKPYFDAIFIDEGQDLIVDKKELLFEGRQPIYWLAYQALKPVSENEPETRRLIWAYDELQSLDTHEIPTAKQLFGNDGKLNTMVRGVHIGGIKKSEIMHKCYRTPGPILTAAHGLGMGLLRPQGMLRGPTTKKDWESIGYVIEEGSFISGQKIVLNRPEKNSPNLVPKHWPDPVIEFQNYDSREKELHAVAQKIKENIDFDDLNPQRDILIIILGNYNTWQMEKLMGRKLQENGINFYIPSALDKNIFIQRGHRKNPDLFWYDNAVTISKIHRAKGNEANMVYVIGVDQVAEDEANFTLRNQLFVALTRARGWVHLSGVGEYPFFQEINSVLENKSRFSFTYKKPTIRELNDEDS